VRGPAQEGPPESTARPKRDFTPKKFKPSGRPAGKKPFGKGR
jgi:hypothetical protein